MKNYNIKKKRIVFRTNKKPTFPNKQNNLGQKIMMLPLFGDFFMLQKKEKLCKRRKTPKKYIENGIKYCWWSKRELINNKNNFSFEHKQKKNKKIIIRIQWTKKKGMEKRKRLFFISSSVTIIMKVYKPKHISIQLLLKHKHT